MKKKITYIVTIILITSFFSCKQNTKKDIDSSVKTSLPEATKSKKKENTRKIAIVNIEAVVNGENFSLTKYNPEKSTDVVYQNNAAQFRITDFDGQSVMVNLQSPEMFSNKPLTISQQTVALPIKEVHNTKEQSKLTFDFKNDDPARPIIYELYDGELIVEEFSDTKIIITFNGRGSKWGINNKKANLFPMQGKIVSEHFTINDFRIN
jgi:hypothetical protein